LAVRNAAWQQQIESDLKPLVHCGGPYVAREVYDKLYQAATGIRRSFNGLEDILTVKQRKALVVLNDVLKEVKQ
jgi:hemoglobin-like flavoprotein